jgi:hypothetical protein
MENTENPLIHVKEKKRNSSKDGRQMVDVDLIPLEPFHTY